MAKLAIKKATTDVTVYVFIQNSSVTTGAGLTGLVYNSASLVASYVRPLAARAALTLATQTVTGAHSDGGFVEVDATNMPGVYRLDLSDAICATGVNSVVVMLKGATNMVPVVLEIQLVSYDPNDAVRAGLTALPNAAAEAAGGLYTRGSGAGQINQPANGQVDVNVEKWNAHDVPAEHTNGYPIATIKDGTGTGEIDTNAGAVVSVTTVGTLTTYTGNTPQTGDSFARIGATGSGLTTLATQASVNTIDDFLDTEIAAITTAVVTDPAGTNIAADVIAIKTVVDAILVDTGTTLDAAIADLPTNAELATSQAAADDATLAAIAALNNLSSAQVQTACVLAITSRLFAPVTMDDVGDSTTSQIDVQLTGYTADMEVNNYWQGMIVLCTAGKNVGACRKIISSQTFGTGEHYLVVSPAFAVTPVGGDQYLILCVADEIMRGTNSAALASAYTSTRAGYLDELAAANIPADVDTLKTRVPDTISLANINAEVDTALNTAIPGSPTADSVNERVKTLDDNFTATVAGRIDTTISSRASQTSVDDLPTNAELATALGTADDATLAAVSALSTKVGTPAGASVSADIAAVKAETASIQTDTNSIETKVDTLVTNVAAILDDTGTSGVVLTAAERTAIADALLGRDMSLVAGVALNERKVLNALRTLRNKVTIVGTTLTVYAEDDTTAAYTTTITTDAAALPITASDPT